MSWASKIASVRLLTDETHAHTHFLQNNMYKDAYVCTHTHNTRFPSTPVSNVTYIKPTHIKPTHILNHAQSAKNLFSHDALTQLSVITKFYFLHRTKFTFDLVKAATVN
jgi:hypothetical protein